MEKIFSVILCLCLLTAFASYQSASAAPSVVLKDSSAVKEKRSWLPGGDSLGGNGGFTAEQDSLYFRAMRLKLPHTTRFAIELQELSSENPFAEAQANTPYNTMMKNLAMIPSSEYAPDPREVVNYQQNIQNAFYVPFTPTLMQNGVKVPLETIGRIFGIIEDVTPKISYTLDVETEVEVVVYSIQATVIQTIFKGTQRPGNYSYTWNLRNEEGRLMPHGDYIIEVRMGNYRYQRKRTVIR